MRQFRRRWGIVLAVVLLVILAQFSFFNPVRDLTRRFFAAPIHLVDNIYSSISGSAKIVISAKDLSKENSDLQNQVLNLQSQVAALATIKTENSQLRQDLNFSNTHPDLKLTPANVINFLAQNSITIDKGSNDGIKVGQAVVSQGFLVGRVGNLSNSTAEVYLLSNRNVLTPVQLTDSGTTGILSGGIKGLVIDNIPMDTKITEGTLVVTSNLEGLYPAGIAVGSVDQSISSKEDVFQSVRVSSPINNSSLSQVFVVSK